MLRASLKTKMTVAVCFIIACLMTGSAFFALNFFESRIRQSIFETQSTFVSRLADELDEKINDFQKHLIGMAMTFPTDVLQDPEMTQRYLDGRVDASFVFDNAITVLSSSGRLIAEHPYVPDSRGTDFSSHGYFRKTIETGMPYISSPYFPSKEEHSPAIMFAVPVFGKKGEIAALLCGSVSLLNHSYFVKLRGVRVGGTGYTYVYDKDRTMVVHPDEKRMGTRDVPVGANKLFDAALAGFEGTGETVTSKGLHVLASFKRLKNVDWIVASNYPVESAYAPLHEARNVFYFLIVAVVVITMTIVWYLMRRLTQPLDAFAEHVRRLPEKKSSEMLFHGKTGDEIETLSDAFNAMVTEMVGKTEALRQSESRYEKAEDIARIGNWQLAVAAGTMSWSSGMYRILGLQSHEFDATLDAFVRCIHPEDRAAFRNSLDGALGKKTGYDIEHRICRPDGAVLFVRNEAEVVLDEKGTPVLVTGNIRDITRRKRNEEALQRSRDFYLTLLEGFPALIWQSGADSLFNFFNRTWLDFTGRSFEQEAGYGWTEQIHPDDREAFLGSYRGAFQSRMPFEAEFRLRRKDGEYRWIVTAGRAFNDVDGSFAGFIGFCYDITYRKNIEGELRKLFRAVEQNPASIVITDTNGTIEYVNPKFCEVTGYSREEAIGANPRILKSAEMPPEGYRELWETILEGREWRGEFHNRKKNGELFWEAASISPIRDAGGNVTHFIAVKEDITGRKVLEAQLHEEKQQLEQAYADLKMLQSQLLQQEKMSSIGQLAAGVAHEINNPVGFIISNLGTLRKYLHRMSSFMQAQADAIEKVCARFPEVDPVRDDLNSSGRAAKIDYIRDDIENLISESLDGAERVKRIVQDLKGFSRIDEAESTMADINAGLESTINIVWNEIKYKAAVHRDFGAIPLTKCNPGQLNQVFMNMLINAAQAIPERGEIRIRTWAEEGSIFIAISDTGAGIPADKLQKVFEPFYTTKDVGKGTGLGLSIAYDIVKKHDGELTVESEPDKGTTFTVRIPVVEV